MTRTSFLSAKTSGVLDWYRELSFWSIIGVIAKSTNARKFERIIGGKPAEEKQFPYMVSDTLFEDKL